MPETVKRKYRHWTARERDFMRRHYGMRSPEPMPVKGIAKALGRTKNEVRGAAARFGLLSGDRCWRLTAHDHFRAAALYLRGACDSEIAGRLGCHRHTVRRWRRRTGRARNVGRPRKVAAAWTT